MPLWIGSASPSHPRRCRALHPAAGAGVLGSGFRVGPGSVQERQGWEDMAEGAAQACSAAAFIPCAGRRSHLCQIAEIKSDSLFLEHSSCAFHGLMSRHGAGLCQKTPMSDAVWSCVHPNSCGREAELCGHVGWLMGLQEETARAPS